MNCNPYPRSALCFRQSPRPQRRSRRLSKRRRCADRNAHLFYDFGRAPEVHFLELLVVKTFMDGLTITAQGLLWPFLRDQWWKDDFWILLAGAFSGTEILFYPGVSPVSCLSGTCSGGRSGRESRATQVSCLPLTWLHQTCFSHQQTSPSQAENSPCVHCAVDVPLQILAGQAICISWVERHSTPEWKFLTSTWRIKSQVKAVCAFNTCTR